MGLLVETGATANPNCIGEFAGRAFRSAESLLLSLLVKLVPVWRSSLTATDGLDPRTDEEASRHDEAAGAHFVVSFVPFEHSLSLFLRTRVSVCGVLSLLLEFLCLLLALECR